MLRTLEGKATTAERKASEVARFGNRYYPVDPTYDKRVYENSAGNYAKIIGCLFGFWICNALHWWGVLSLGIVNSNALSWYSIGCFFFTIFFLGALLCSGRGANKLKRQHEFYNEKLAEIRAETQEKANKAEQERLHEDKLKLHQKKLAEINAANAVTSAPSQGGAPAMQMQQQIINPSINNQPPQ